MLVADVLAGANFKDGVRVTDDNEDDDETTDERAPSDVLLTASFTTLKNCLSPEDADSMRAFAVTPRAPVARCAATRRHAHPSGAPR